MSIHTGRAALTTLSRITGLICVLSLAAVSAGAGDRPGVLAALDEIPGNWSEAQLTASLAGGTQGEVVLGSNLAFEYRAHQPGYVALVHVSSHGDMTLMRAGASEPLNAGKSDTFQAAEPLGTETVYLLFSDSPFDSLFTTGKPDQQLGDSRSAADALVARLNGLEQQQKLTVSRLQYQVVAQTGRTEYTTRGIVRTVVDADEEESSDAAERTFPARIEFAFNSADLTQQGRLDLDVFGEAMLSQQLADRTISLAGHTDSVGEESYNCSLSLRRAQAARDYLVKGFGIQPQRIDLAGYGEARPIAANDSEASRHQNRRVEFVFGKPGEAVGAAATGCTP